MSSGDFIFTAGDWRQLLENRPIIIALAGSNGAGKSTFFKNFLEPTGLPFVNADVISLQFGCDAYTAAAMAEDLRKEWLRERRSFIFETVFSDPVGEKVEFLCEAAQDGYTVALIFIGISSPDLSIDRVSMRVTQGGHDVPDYKLIQRFPRTLSNLRRAIRRLPLVLVFDNSDLAKPYQQVALFENGILTRSRKPLPDWFRTEDA